MNVASLELCKELYELSGWEGDYQWHLPGSNTLWEWRAAKTHKDATPVYNLGYLLRKLPPLTHITKFDDTYRAFLMVKGEMSEVTAETPEDAAAKLAIELFKQGVLVHV